MIFQCEYYFRTGSVSRQNAKSNAETIYVWVSNLNLDSGSIGVTLVKHIKDQTSKEQITTQIIIIVVVVVIIIIVIIGILWLLTIL